jgi:phage terminase large subunit GpA-like protein
MGRAAGQPANRRKTELKNPTPSPFVLSENGRKALDLVAFLLQPALKLTPDQWAKENRVYPVTAGVPGPRDPFMTPYKIPFARAIASGRYKRVVDVSGAQMGKTDTLLDVIGHRLDQRPAPILYVGPTKQFLQEQFEPRIMGLLDEAPTLMRKVLRGKKMTKTRKVIAGVPLRLAHGGSSAALKSDPAALAIIDEIDELLANVKGQGDPLGLVEARGDTYADFTVAITSTPSVGSTEIERDEKSGLSFWKMVPGEDIESTVWKLWQQGSRHHFAWRCPHCSQWFIPRFALLHWPKNATPAQARREAYMTCGHEDCGGIIEESHKAAMNASGQMIAPGQWFNAKGEAVGEPDNDSSTLSFWTSGLCSPFVSFGERAEDYLLAVRSGDHGKTQTVINAGFGELWAAGGGDVPELAEVFRLKVPYSKLDVPAGVIALTCGVDVQKNRLVFVVRGWGAGGSSWLIDHGELWGATAEPEVWAKLTDVLESDFSGKRIRLAIIDSGFRPNKLEGGAESIVYDYCRRMQRICRPSKGVETLAEGALKISKIEISPQGGKHKYGLDLIRINTDWCKLWIHERIRWPHDQPGAFFLPQDVTDDYCMQLISEARVKSKLGKPTWVRRSHNNHYLDCEAMAYAAGYVLNVHRFRSEAKPFTPREVNEDGMPQTKKVEEVPLRAPQAEKRPARPPTVVRSKFLRR